MGLNTSRYIDFYLREISVFQLLRNHIVEGLVGSRDLDDDMVGPSLEGTKLRSNVYRTENSDWQEIDVSSLVKVGTQNTLKSF